MITELSRLGELKTGYQLRKAAQHNDDGSHTIIQLGDVRDEGIDLTRLTRMELDRVRERDLVFPGDLLLRSRGASYRAALVLECPSGTVATAPLYIFRLQSDLALPEYLVWFLNRDATQGILTGAAHGTHIPTVSIEAFTTLQIVVPPLPIQHQIIEVEALLRSERALSLHLLEKQEQLAKTHLERIIKFHRGEDQT